MYMDPNNEPKGIKFETDSYKAVKFYNESDTPKIVKIVMKYSGGAIKDEKQASYALFGFVVLAILVSLFLFFGTGPRSSNGKIDDQMLLLHPDLAK